MIASVIVTKSRTVSIVKMVIFHIREIPIRHVSHKLEKQNHNMKICFAFILACQFDKETIFKFCLHVSLNKLLIIWLSKLDRALF